MYYKLHKTLLVAIFVAICSITSAQKKEAYVELDNESGIMTFYYDSDRSDRENDTYDVNDSYGYEGPPWSDYKIAETIKTVVFDETFAAYTPYNCHRWFYDCGCLTEIKGMENLNTEMVTDMSEMFRHCINIETIDLSHFDTGNVTDMSWMFSDCFVDNLDLSSFDTRNVENMERMFSSACYLETLDLTSFNTSKVLHMMSMFAGCTYLESLDLTSFNTENVEHFENMFANSYSLKTIYVGDEWSTKSVLQSYDMFAGCDRLYGEKGSSAFEFDVTDKSYAKIDGGEKSPGFFTSKGGKPFPAPEAYKVIDRETGIVTFYYDKNRPEGARMHRSFSGWYYRINGETINLAPEIKKAVFDPSFDDFHTRESDGWFQNCINLEVIEGIEFLHTERDTSMRYMFENCESLSNIDLSGFNTSNVIYMLHMFDGCKSLKTLNISSFNTQNVTHIQSMFRGCTNLETIYVGDEWTTESVINNKRKGNLSSDMFTGCEKLIGGKGTIYNSKIVDMTYARIDEGEDNPGYFSIYEAKPTITSISVSSLPKIEYIKGEELDLTGGIITVTYDDGTNETVSISEAVISGYDPQKVGVQKVKVFYVELETEFEVTVVEPHKDPVIVSIAINKLPTKITYIVGDKLDLTGGSISVVYDNGDIENVSLDKTEVTGFKSETTGTQKLTVSYLGKATSFEVTVSDNVTSKTVVSISVSVLPTKTEYVKGTQLDLSDGFIEIKYNDNTTETVELTKTQVSGFDSNVCSRQSIAVHYFGKTTWFDVVVNPPEIKQISINSLPAKTTYYKGDELNLDGGKITIILKDGNIEYANISDAEISGYSPNKVGRQEITVSYYGKKTTFDVVVKEKQQTPVSSIFSQKDINVWSYNHIIYIENAADAEYKIIDTNGRLITTSKIKSSHEEIKINKSGVLIVIIGNQTFKVNN